MPAEHVSIDGVELPAQLGGHPALEFCNTLAGWNGGPGRDYLRSYEHLARWAAYVQLAPQSQVQRLLEQARGRPRDADAVLARARRLRADLYAVLASPPPAGAPPAAAFDALAAAVAGAAAELRLRRDPRGARLAIAEDAGLTLPLHAVSWSAAQLVTSADAAHVHACPGTGCGWLFLDRTGRRRWCTMATCGNRAKARRFAGRRRHP